MAVIVPSIMVMIAQIKAKAMNRRRSFLFGELEGRSSPEVGAGAVSLALCGLIMLELLY